MTERPEKRPIRVLYVIDSLASGGAQRQLVTLVNALDRHDVSPDVAIYHPLHHFRPELEQTGTPVHQLGTMGGRDPRVIARLALLIHRERFDLVHTRLKTSGVLARVATLLGRRPRIVLSEGGLSLEQSRWRIAAERLLEGRADAMIVNAEVIRRQVEELVPALSGRVHFVASGLDWGNPAPETIRSAGEFRARHLGGDADVLLGVVARVDRVKNPHLLLDAMELLPEDVRQRLKVVWIGALNDPELAASVRGRAEEGAIRGRFLLLPPTQRVRVVHMALDALILSSSSEGLPNVVLEAFWDGTPVLATDVGDVHAVVRSGESGWLIRPDDPGALAAAIVEAVSMPADRRKQMGAAGSALVRRDYSSARMADRTMAVYRRVLGSECRGEPKGGSA